MADVLPLFRSDIQVTIHREGGEVFLVLHDVFGYADGPIMVHSDMISILELCDGETTWEVVARNSGVDIDGPEMTKVRAFIGQLDALGFFESESGEQRAESVRAEWDALEARPPICAGSTYPADPDELRTFLDDMLSAESGEQRAESGVHTWLIPHIDYRVSPAVYAPAFNALKDSTADLFVMIGTSHYWSDDRVILTDKDFATPLGDVHTDKALVAQLRNALYSDLPSPDSALRSPVSALHSPVSALRSPLSDIAHKPEHSLELHAVLLRHVRVDSPFTILPILVTGVGGEGDEEGLSELMGIADVIRGVVGASGRKAVYLISGDLSHVGRKFGDSVSAAAMLSNVHDADQAVIDRLKGADVVGYHGEIEHTGHAYRVCGHAPTILGLAVSRPQWGDLLAYDVWNEQETESAVSFATMAFGGNLETP